MHSPHPSLRAQVRPVRTPAPCVYAPRPAPLPRVPRACRPRAPRAPCACLPRARATPQRPRPPARPACRARPAPSLLLKWAVAHFRLCTLFFFPYFFQLLENTKKKKIYTYFFSYFPGYSIKFIKIYFLQFSSILQRVKS